MSPPHQTRPARRPRRREPHQTRAAQSREGREFHLLHAGGREVDVHGEDADILAVHLLHSAEPLPIRSLFPGRRPAGVRSAQTGGARRRVVGLLLWPAAVAEEGLCLRGLRTALVG